MTKERPTTGRFHDLGIDEKLLATLTKKGFETPTPIQHQVIPGALEGKDVIGIAQTGTGKTLAFGVPMIQSLAKKKGQGLVVVPTRELALQVEKAISEIGTSFGLRTAVIIGGVAQHPQVRALHNNPHIVIATPGRLADLMKQKVYNLSSVNTIVLDEADRMLDVGFLPEIKRILSAAPKERQIMLFSATMPKSISELASAFMQLPIRIEIAPQGTASELVEQEVFIVVKSDKMRLLDSILEQYRDQKVLVFSRTKYGAKRIALDIRSMGHSATEIHSNRSQAQRKIALDGFSTGRFRVMVATDIAARGIDVKDIGIVLNFDLPDCLEDYVHRIGRTGRAGKYGKSISFATPGERYDIKKIERLINKTLPILSLPTLPAARPKSAAEERYPSSGGRGRTPSRGGFGGRSNSSRPQGGFGSRSGSSRGSGRFDSRSKPSDSSEGFGDRKKRSFRPKPGSGSRVRSPRPQGGYSGRSRTPRSQEGIGERGTNSFRPQTGYNGRPRTPRSREGTEERSSTFRPKVGVSRTRKPRTQGGYGSKPKPFRSKGEFSGSTRDSRSLGTYESKSKNSRPKGKFGSKPKTSRPKTGFGSKPRSFGSKKRFTK
jgi:ATP-dependent RNA helicase RhlE